MWVHIVHIIKNTINYKIHSHLLLFKFYIGFVQFVSIIFTTYLAISFTTQIIFLYLYCPCTIYVFYSFHFL